jgi:hypothetical protein
MSLGSNERQAFEKYLGGVASTEVSIFAEMSFVHPCDVQEFPNNRNFPKIKKN